MSGLTLAEAKRLSGCIAQLRKLRNRDFITAQEHRAYGEAILLIEIRIMEACSAELERIKAQAGQGAP